MNFYINSSPSFSFNAIESTETKQIGADLSASACTIALIIVGHVSKAFSIASKSTNSPCYNFTTKPTLLINETDPSLCTFPRSPVA